MSWGIETKEPVRLSDVVAEIKKACEDAPAAVEAAGEHLVPAIKAAEALAAAVVRDGDKVWITLSGHHNPGNVPVSGWADSRITVTVSQHPAAAPSEE